ncbi:hypothetical protein E0485_06930 [Paenibacillus albiflavus]|uniref:Polymer-forming cytoskeletal protein n=1 Tax=Paenibacillus albiflavus TaxID=2545760 RepID=A0A4R4EFG7_9BACL|nr:polymer-forming cytoskeletal protein [Paenibacillus albiflavus]TCZ78804.1 hypothetical protein E0485_06930 [Paenibacillus albiflavus]
MNSSPNLNISGMGKTSGGVYQKVQLDGLATVNGDVTCQSFDCNGKGKINGDLQADTISIDGLCSIDGNTRAHSIRVDGKASLYGNINCEQFMVNGIIDIDGDCQAETFKADGCFKINGLLNSGTIDVNLRGKCTAEEIGGERINVVKGKNNNSIMNSFFTAELRVDVIEGDKIYLENTKADIVRGNEVAIGPGCVIDEVEYKVSLYIDDEAKVESHKQV